MKKLIVFVMVFSLWYTSNGQNNSDETNTTKNANDTWHFDIAPYMWFSSITGDVSFLNQTVPVEVEFKDIWDQLSFGILLHGEAQKGHWTVISDFIYMKLREDGAIRNTAQTTTIEVQQIIAEFAAAYEFLNFQEYLIVEGYGGLRYFKLAPEFRLNQLIIFDNSFDFLDPYFGLRFKSINKKWSNAMSFDLGGFGIGSQISWKLHLNVGYRFSDSLSLHVGYQGLNVDYKGEDSFRYDVFTGGFLTGLNISL